MQAQHLAQTRHTIRHTRHTMMYIRHTIMQARHPTHRAYPLQLVQGMGVLHHVERLLCAHDANKQMTRERVDDMAEFVADGKC